MENELAGKYTEADVYVLVREAKRLREVSFILIKTAVEIDLELTLRLIVPVPAIYNKSVKITFPAVS